MASSPLPLSSEDPLQALGAKNSSDAESDARAPPEKKLKVAPDSPSSQHPQSEGEPEVELEEVDQNEFAFLDTVTHLATLQSGMHCKLVY